MRVKMSFLIFFCVFLLQCFFSLKTAQPITAVRISQRKKLSSRLSQKIVALSTATVANLGVTNLITSHLPKALSTIKKLFSDDSEHTLETYHNKFIVYFILPVLLTAATRLCLPIGRTVRHRVIMNIAVYVLIAVGNYLTAANGEFYIYYAFIPGLFVSFIADLFTNKEPFSNGTAFLQLSNWEVLQEYFIWFLMSFMFLRLSGVTNDRYSFDLFCSCILLYVPNLVSSLFFSSVMQIKEEVFMRRSEPRQKNRYKDDD